MAQIVIVIIIYFFLFFFMTVRGRGRHGGTLMTLIERLAKALSLSLLSRPRGQLDWTNRRHLSLCNAMQSSAAVN